MYQYNTVKDAIEDLRRKGYTEDFNLKENCLLCNNSSFGPEDFEIKEVYRFEGASDPDEEAIVYGIESKNGIKGILVNSYGYRSDSMSDAIARKLQLNAF